MAINLTVTYTPNYSGCHRIYFSMNSTGPFCMYLDDTLSVVGDEKEVVIDLETYSECLGSLPVQQGCEAERVYGYVQPCCTEDEPSPTSEFIALFDTIPCTSYAVKCLDPGGCGSFTKVNCDGTPDPATYEYAYDATGKVIVCSSESPVNTPLSTYTFQLAADQNSCCDCINVTVSSSNPLVEFFVYYYDCKSETTTTTKVTSTPKLLPCIALGSLAAVLAADQANLVVSLGAYCD